MRNKKIENLNRLAAKNFRLCLVVEILKQFFWFIFDSGVVFNVILSAKNDPVFKNCLACQDFKKSGVKHVFFSIFFFVLRMRVLNFTIQALIKGLTQVSNTSGNSEKKMLKIPQKNVFFI